MEIKIDLNEPKILEKVTNDRFGLFVSSEWKRLLDPFTPRDTGLLEESATLSPWEIYYKQKYSARVYYGEELNFQKKNPYSTYEWDVKASQSGQLNKLYRTLNNALQSGKF
jgi:hypothetical protein